MANQLGLHKPRTFTLFSVVRPCNRMAYQLGLHLWQYGLWSFQTRGTKLERFLHKNQHTQRKLLNFENSTNGEPQQLAKIRVFKVDYFILPLFLVAKLRSVAKFFKNEWKKHPYFSKINEFERKKSEKKQKNSKNLKVAGNYPNI